MFKNNLTNVKCINTYPRRTTKMSAESAFLANIQKRVTRALRAYAKNRI